MAKKWYILHTYSGYEAKIEKIIRLHLENGELDKNIVYDVKVPLEEVIEVKNGKKKTVHKKFLPSYIMIEMDLPTIGWNETCNKIRKIQGVSGFVGVVDSKMPPKPLSDDEAKALLMKAGEIKGEKPVKMKQNFEVDEQVKIIGGPFDSFQGKIKEIDEEKGKIFIEIGIFGRATKVEVDFLQVEKL